MIAFTVGLLLVSLVSGLPAPRAEADPEPLPEPLPEPEANPEADPEADPHYGGYGLGFPYGGVIEEVLPPVFIEGAYEEVIVGPEYPGIHTLLGRAG